MNFKKFHKYVFTAKKFKKWCRRSHKNSSNSWYKRINGSQFLAMEESSTLPITGGFTVTTEWCKEIPLTAKEKDLIADGNFTELGLTLAYEGMNDQSLEEVGDYE